jgi:hypothetical protein
MVLIGHIAMYTDFFNVTIHAVKVFSEEEVEAKKQKGLQQLD